MSKYNRIVSIQRKISVADTSYGGHVEIWTTYATVWASVMPLKGRELIAAQAAQSEVTTRIGMYYRADVKPVDRIIHGANIYNIMSVIDPEDAHKELQIMATTGLNEG